MKTVILAAGQGKRMQGFGNGIPKCLIPINGEPAILRLLRQISPYTKDITVVVGYKKELLTAKLDNVNVVVNDKYETDTNLVSFKIGTQGITEPYIVFEADVIVHDSVVADIFKPSQRSYWFTIGGFKLGQVGCILKSDGKISDIRIVAKYEDEFKHYNKVVGILRVGRGELEKFHKFIDMAERDQYYIQPWIDNLDDLECYEVELFNNAYSFNTKEELWN